MSEHDKRAQGLPNEGFQSESIQPEELQAKEHQLQALHPRLKNILDPQGEES